MRRQRITIFFSVLFVLVFAFTIWLSWRPGWRIKEVTIYGADQSLATLAQKELTGTYFYIVPRNSILFVPEGDIRMALMRHHPEIAALSIFREGLSGLSIKINERVPIALWCGLAPMPGTPENCYAFDADGYVYVAASQLAATTNPTPINSFFLYEPLVGNVQDPLRAVLAHADQLPSAFDFARELATVGTSTASTTLVSKIVVRNDEVDDLLVSGTRVTYLLGDEKNAFTALSSARADYNLSDGSITYVDLRFPGKIYVKKK